MYTFTIRSLFEGRNEKRPILALVGNGRIPQFEGDWEIGFKLDRLRIREGIPVPNATNTLEL